MNFKKHLALLLAMIIALVPAMTSCKTIGGDPSDSQSGAASSDSAQSSEAFNYSEGIDENGYWLDLKALELVVLPEDILSISVPRDKVTVTDDKYNENLREYLGDFLVETKVYDRPVKDGDTVNIDYVGSIDGVEFSGGSTGGKGTTVTIGVTSYIDDFLDQLVDANVGDTVNVEVTFPDPYKSNTDLSGKDAVFVTKINYIVEKTLPEINDEFVQKNLKEYTGCETAEAFQTYFRELLYEIELSQYIQEYITDNTTVTELPSALYQFQEDSMLAYYSSLASSYGMELEYIISALTNYSTVEQLIAGYREENEKSAKSLLIYQAIAEKGALSVSDDDIKQYFKEYVGTEDYSSIAEVYGMPYIKMMVLNQLALDYCIEHALVTD